MFPLLPAALFGFVVGLRHATDADHVAAVGAIVARERTVRGAALIGAAWGLGHTVTLLVLGGTIVVFGLAVPRHVGLALELCVGVMLIGLGAWNFVSRSRGKHAPHALGAAGGPHTHTGNDAGGSHAHSLDDAGASDAPGASHTHSPVATRGPVPSPARRALRPLVVGSMHGLAGSAAAALLVVATVRDPSWGLAYLFVFGMGTMLGMTLLTTALALPLGRALERFRNAELWLRIGSGALSVAIGAFVVYEIGFRDGLFLQ